MMCLLEFSLILPGTANKFVEEYLFFGASLERVAFCE